MTVWRLSLSYKEPARLRLADAEIEVEARQVEGPLYNSFGLVVRGQLHEDSLYWFGISGDGYYSVHLLESGEWIPLVAEEASDAIHQGLNATNWLRIACKGDRFDFYVNDALLTSLNDDTFGSGYFGLAVGTREPGVVICFDNLKVYTLAE
jgi:hypothetical protein